MPQAESGLPVAFAAALLSALVAFTCSPSVRLEPRRPAPVPRASGGPVASATSGALPVASAAIEGPVASPEALPLGRFYRSLSALEQKARTDHVRILWLGDSHTAADYLTGAVRRLLEQRFGSGGPGFLRVGASPYRHDGVKVVREGRFRVEPEPPSRRTTEGDRTFGTAGLRTLPVDDRARAEVRVDPKRAQGSVRYELLFDLPPGARFRVTLGANRTVVRDAAALPRVAGSPILRQRFEAPAADGFTLDDFDGAPRFYGVIAEGTGPGVVLDTSGIDGARLATVLAWDPAVLAAELAARPPELVVVAFGTNEAFDNRRADASKAEVEELVARLRRGAPQADCLVVGPPDAASPDLTSLPRVSEIEVALRGGAEAVGCGFFSLRGAMGGDGGFARFLRESPPLARADRVHLTPAGYVKLGEALGNELLSAYDRSKQP